jgi:preprotein translocase subunit YajC
MNFFDNALYAASQQPAPDPFMSFLPILVIFGVFYFLMIRPQMKQNKAHKQMVEALSEGEEIITNGGVLGKITNVGEQFLTLKISDGVEIKLQRHHVAKILPKGTIKTS